MKKNTVKNRYSRWLSIAIERQVKNKSFFYTEREASIEKAETDLNWGDAQARTSAPALVTALSLSLLRRTPSCKLRNYNCREISETVDELDINVRDLQSRSTRYLKN